PVILKRPTEIKEPLSDKGKLNNIADDDIEMIDGSEKRKGPDKVYTPRVPHTISKSYEAEASDYFSDYEQEHESHWVDPSYGHLSHVMDVGELKPVLDRSLYAMGTGRLRVKIGERDDINCMIDTGSELNLISRRLQES